MDNPFLPPDQVQRFLKISVEGPYGSGKTVFGLLAKEVPALGKVAVVSGEQGELLYIKHPRWGGFHRLPTQSLEVFENGVRFLRENPGVYGTLVVDTVTNLYEALVIAKMDDAGDLSLNEWGPIKRKFKSLMTDLVNLPMNIVFVVHEVDITERKGMESKVVGQKADAEKSFGRNPDTIIRVYMEGKKRLCLVKKDRTSTFETGSIIEDPHISMWAAAIIEDGKQERQLTPDEIKAENEKVYLRPGAELLKKLIEEVEAGFSSAEAKKEWLKAKTDEIKSTLDAGQTKVLKAAIKDAEVKTPPVPSAAAAA